MYGHNSELWQWLWWTLWFLYIARFTLVQNRIRNGIGRMVSKQTKHGFAKVGEIFYQVNSLTEVFDKALMYFLNEMNYCSTT
jgi:hypothetical protein